MTKMHSISIIAKRVSPESREEAQQIISSLTYKSDTSVFLTDDWQLSWLASLPTLPDIVLFYTEGKHHGDPAPVGYTLLGTRAIKPYLPFQVSLVNQSGHTKSDQVWVEFNDIICPDTMKLGCIKALTALVFKRYRNLQLTVSMCHKTAPWEQVCQQNNITYSTLVTLAYRHKLPGAKQDIETQLYNALSANSRQQMRRTQRAITSTFGHITLTEAKHSEQRDYFSALSPLHILKWGGTDEGSGFQNPYFVAHHTHLISQSPDRVALIKVTAGSTLLGYAYYLKDERNIYFYCAGVNEEIATNKVKPGHVLHFLAMAHFAAQGYEAYDFMAGDFRYKKSLSNEGYTMATLTLVNPSRLSRLIDKSWSGIKKALHAVTRKATTPP